MKRFMIVMNTLEKCYYFMKFKNLPQSDCILISFSDYYARDRMRGYYNQVMSGEIELFGITKQQFCLIYNGGKINNRYPETELKSSCLANRELKIIKGYLQGNTIVIEDWWKKITGNHWQTDALTNPAAYNYCIHHQRDYENYDKSVDLVLYGKIGGSGYLVNVNELELPENYKPEEDYIFISVEEN